MDRGAWWATVNGVTRNQSGLSNYTTTTKSSFRANSVVLILDYKRDSDGRCLELLLPDWNQASRPESLGVGPRHQCFSEIPRRFHFVTKFTNH